MIASIEAQIFKGVKFNWGRAEEKKLSVDLPRSWPGWNAGCRSSSACREPRARSPTCSRRTPRTCREPGTAPRRSCPWRAMPIKWVTMQSYRSAMDLRAKAWRQRHLRWAHATWTKIYQSKSPQALWESDLALLFRILILSWNWSSILALMSSLQAQTKFLSQNPMELKKPRNFGFFPKFTVQATDLQLIYWATCYIGNPSNPWFGLAWFGQVITQEANLTVSTTLSNSQQSYQYKNNQLHNMSSAGPRSY